jgi:hypothetical protein
MEARRQGAAPAGLAFPKKRLELLQVFAFGLDNRRDHPMRHEGAQQMVLQTTVALLAMGLAVLSLMFMGRWV